MKLVISKRETIRITLIQTVSKDVAGILIRFFNAKIKAPPPVARAATPKNSLGQR